MLTRYVEHRAACLAEVVEAVNVTKDTAKGLFIRMMFNGSVDKWVVETEGVEAANIPQWVFKLQEELRASATALLAKSKFDELKSYIQSRPQKPNVLGTTMAVYLQTQERLCVEALVAAVGVSNRKVGSIIFDGVHVEKLEAEDGMPTELMGEWSRHIFKATGLEVGLSCKAFACNPLWMGAARMKRCDYDEEWMERPWSYEEMKSKFEERSCKIVYQCAFIREGRERMYTFTHAKLLEAFQHMHYTVVDTTAEDGEGTVKTHPFMKRWTADKNVRKYEVADMYPPPLVCPADTYNMWRGFAAELYQPTKPVDTDSEGVRALVGHWNMLLGEDTSSLAYVLDWQAQILQQPAVKPGIAIVLKSEEGCGKNRALDIMNAVLGPEKFLETGKPASDLYGRFTSQRDGRFLVAINESSGSDNFSADNTIKDMITSPSFSSEGKGTNAFTLRCYARFIFTTNNDNCLKIHAGSRRFVVFEGASTRKDDEEYFRGLSRHIADPHTQHEFYKLLMARDLTKRNWIKDRPITKFYMQMVEANMPYEHAFVKDRVLQLHMAGEVTAKATAEALTTEFQSWLLVNGPVVGARPYDTNARKLGVKLTKLTAEHAGTGGFEGFTKSRSHAGITYNLDVRSMVQAMVGKKWVTAEECVIVRNYAFADDT